MTHSANLARAAQQYRAGNLPGALREAERALAFNPRDLPALRLAGVLACQTGDPERGAQWLRRALTLDPADEILRLNLVRALLDTNQVDAAGRIIDEAPVSASAELLRAKASVARVRGSSADAVDMLRQAVAAHPDDPLAWNNLGNALLANDEVAEAIEALERASALAPGVALPLVNLGRALTAADRHDEALSKFQSALEAEQDDAHAHFEVGKALVRRGDAAEAMPHLGTAARSLRDQPNVFVVLGLAFARLDDGKNAEQSYRMALRVDPTHAPAYLNLAIVLERANRLDELTDLYGTAVDSGADKAELHYIAALIARRDGREAEALELIDQVQPESLDTAMRQRLIGELSDRAGDYERAFAAFSKMNEISASRPDAAGLSRTARHREIARRSQGITPAWGASWSEPHRITEPPSPAFLVGFLRSGTTLLDTMLMGHPDTQVLEEEPMLAQVEHVLGDQRRLVSLPPEEALKLRNVYFGELSRPYIPGKLLIDKNPLATLRAPLIHRMFPDARFIFALRHPCDVVLSCFMQNFLLSEAMAGFLDLENAAKLYSESMNYWERARAALPLSVHTVRYEDLVADTEGQVRPLLDFLGLPWDDQVLEHQKTAASRGTIRTPSYSQVTEGIYKRAQGRWTHYRKHFDKALPILQPWIDRYGYDS